MTKLLFVTDLFPPEVGGPATFLKHLAEYSSKIGHEVVVVSSSVRNSFPEDASSLFRIVRIANKGTIRYKLSLIFRLLQFMCSQNVIFINTLEYPACRVAKLLHRDITIKIVGDVVWETARNLKKTVLSVDDFQHNPINDPFLNKLVSRRLSYLGYAHKIIVPSRYLKDLVKGWGIDDAKINIVPNGIPLDIYDISYPRPRLAGPLQLAFAGRLVNWKGVDTLIRAVSEIENVETHIFGDGPELEYLKLIAHKESAANTIHFHNSINEYDLIKFLKNIHVIVLDSLYEGHSHTLLQANGLGIPSIASKCGGNPEIIQDGWNGLLVPPGNVEALKESILKLRNDETLRLKMASNALILGKKFSFENTAILTLKNLGIE